MVAWGDNVALPSATCNRGTSPNVGGYGVDSITNAVIEGAKK